MNLQNVFERFVLLSGISRKEAAKWLPLCSDSFEEIKSKLKDETETPEYLVYECASSMAYYKYCLMLRTKVEDRNFSAGDIKITKAYSDDMVKAAFTLYSDAMLKAGGFFKDDGSFVFEAL